MGFNIKDLLEKKIQKQQKPELEIINVLKEYVPGIEKKDFIFIQGVIQIKNISPIKKTHIKLHKRLILKKLKNDEFLVRDIM